MALVSHRKKFIFLKTAKTAGTSVECYFEKYCLPEGEYVFSHQREMHYSEAGIVGARGPLAKESEWYHHMSASQIKAKLSDDVWNEYLKFTVVRNPYDKLVSAFHHFGLSDKNLAKQEKILLFRNWLKSGGRAIDRNVYTIDNEIVVDEVIKFESLLEGLERVCNKLSVAFEPGTLLSLKDHHRKDKSEIAVFFDQESKEIVESAYQFELQHFGYSLPL